MNSTNNDGRGDDPIPGDELERIAQKHLEKECQLGADCAATLGHNLRVLRNQLAHLTDVEFRAYCRRHIGLTSSLLRALIRFTSSGRK